MSALTYSLWLGKTASLAVEVAKLIDLLKQVEYHQFSILLAPQQVADHDWIGDTVYHPKQSTIQPGYLGLLTSGTTGNPKIIWHQLSVLLTHKRKNQDHNSRWLLCYNPARWAGLSLLLHITKCGQLLIPQDLAISSIMSRLPETTHLSLTPSLFRKMLVTDPDLLASAPIKRIIFGGEYATQSLLDTASNIFPQARITHVYSTTELGDICTVNDGNEGIPIANITVPFILEDNELIINHRPTGDLWRQNHDRLYFMSRKANIINVGGFKVYAQEVENVIMTMPGITDCIVYAINNPFLGQVVGLQYVGDVKSNDIKAYLRPLLPKPAIPVVIMQLDELTLSDAWKKSCAS